MATLAGHVGLDLDSSPDGPCVRRKGASQSIKFPDLISVRDDLCLWWEFKAIGTRTLHPKKAGGTFVKDVHALCAFDSTETIKYLAGHPSKARSRDDGSYIAASKLGDKICAAKQHVGVALIFAPGKDELECCNPHAVQRRWRPAERLAELRKEIEGIKTELATGGAAERIWEIPSGGEVVGGELRESTPGKGSGLVEGEPLPQWAGWMVSMPWSG